MSVSRGSVRPRGRLAAVACVAAVATTAAAGQGAPGSCFVPPATIAGEPATFELTGAPPLAPYVFDVSLAGTSPGRVVAGMPVPLNGPFLFWETLGGSAAFGALFVGFAGTTDAQGRAVATTHVPPLEALAGVALSGAFLVLDPVATATPIFASSGETTVVVRPVAAASGFAAPFVAIPPSHPVAPAPATHFVAPTGADANDGLTPATAWREISHAAGLVGPGAVVEIADGAYAGPVLIQNKAGTEAAPLVFRAAGAAAVLTGSGSANNTVKNSIFIGGSSWVTVQGLKVFASQRAGVRVSLSHHVTIRDCVFGGHQKWGIFSDYADDLVVVGNECFGAVDEHGVYLSNSGDRAVVVGNLCRDNHASGIQINADPAFLDPIGGYAPDGVSSRCVIARNFLMNNGAAGGAAINLASVRRSVVRDAVIVNDLWSNSTGVALWDDGAGPAWGCKDVLIEHVTTAHGSGVGRYALSLLNGSTGATVRNNVLRGGRRGGLAWTVDALPGLRSNGNVFWSVDGWPALVQDDVAFVPYTLAAWQALGHDLQSVAAPPAFAAPATGDWSLVPGSPGRDQGVPATSLVDYQGAPRPAGAGRDVGAYER